MCQLLLLGDWARRAQETQSPSQGEARNTTEGGNSGEEWVEEEHRTIHTRKTEKNNTVLIQKTVAARQSSICTPHSLTYPTWVSWGRGSESIRRRNVGAGGIITWHSIFLASWRSDIPSCTGEEEKEQERKEVCMAVGGVEGKTLRPKVGDSPLRGHIGESLARL